MQTVRQQRRKQTVRKPESSAPRPHIEQQTTSKLFAVRQITNEAPVKQGIDEHRLEANQTETVEMEHQK